MIRKGLFRARGWGASVGVRHVGAISKALVKGIGSTAQINWFDTYKLNHHALRHMFYENPKKADTYFKPATKAKKEKAPPAETQAK